MEPSSQQEIQLERADTSERPLMQLIADIDEGLQMASSSSGQHVVNIHELVDSTSEAVQMASSSRQHVVDNLLASTEKKLLMLPLLSSEPCIYRVPNIMRVSNEQDFTPQIVSIGPIHYQNEKLRENEHLKERYLAEFRQHTGVSLKECYELVLDNERRLRNCYADVVKLDSETFVRMVLVDAAFLTMTLVYHSCRKLVSRTDQLFRNPHMINDIKYGMVLLENQLPFFILEDLYKLSKLQNIVESMSDLNFNEETAMTVFAHQFLKDFLTPKVPERHPPSKPEHILDLYRSCLIPADWNPERHGTETKDIPSMKKLYQAGVKIQVGCKENMFDIRFNDIDGILEIPPLEFYGSTEVVFKNLLAYELCHRIRSRIFTDYFWMMRLLTVSPEDTELLVQKGVIFNGLQNAERVSTLFQNINTGNLISWPEFLYSDVIRDLNKHYRVDWNKWKATLKDKYFKAPWAICSVSLAVVLLVLTIVQTVFTILQVVLQK